MNDPTPKQLVQAAEIVRRWAESRGDPLAQEVSMALYTVDNMMVTALAANPSSSSSSPRSAS